MLKKARAGVADEPAKGAKDLSDKVLESSRQIWLAGLGAFARAQAEGSKVFETLVQQGQVLESKTKRAAADTAAAARGAAHAKAKEMQAIAGGTWDKLEQVFEQRVERALSKLGVYTQNDVQRLGERVDALSEAVNELIRQTGAQTKVRTTSPMQRIVKGAVSSAARTATGAVTTAARTAGSAARTASGAVSSATKTARKTVRTASKVAKAALK